MIDISGLVIRNPLSTIDVSCLMVEDIVSATNVGCSVKTLIWQRSLEPPFTKPLALVALVAESSVFVVYFKKIYLSYPTPENVLHVNFLPLLKVFTSIQNKWNIINHFTNNLIKHYTSL